MVARDVGVKYVVASNSPLSLAPVVVVGIPFVRESFAKLYEGIGSTFRWDTERDGYTTKVFAEFAPKHFVRLFKLSLSIQVDPVLVS